MSWGRRVVTFPLTRIVLAAAPIVALAAALSSLAQRFGRVAGALVPVVAGAAALLVYAGYVRLVERRAVVELARAGAVAEAARGFVLGATLFCATLAVLALLGVAHVGRGDGAFALLAGLASALGAALLEETLMRAVFFRIVEESLGTWLALALSAALFGALHAANPGATLVSSVAIALEAGVLLAAAFACTRRLWLPIGVHLAWNFTEGGLFGASVSGTRPFGLFHSRFGGAPLVSGGAFGPEASVVAIVVCLAAGVWLCVVAARRGRVVPPFWRRGSASSPAPPRSHAAA